MRGKAFFDTNLLIYADDPADPVKQSIAREIILDSLRHEQGVLSTQVLLEYSAGLVRHLGLSPAFAAERVRFTAGFECVALSTDVVSRALDIMSRHSFSIWDAAIISAAVKGGCQLLFSEDMQHGFRLDGTTIVNPFT